MSESDFKASQIILQAIDLARKLTGASVCVKNLSHLMSSLLSCEFPLECHFHYAGYCRMCQKIADKTSGFCNILHYITLPERCIREKKVFLNVCEAGVCEAVIPIFFNGELISVMLLGQCRARGKRMSEAVGDSFAFIAGANGDLEILYEELPEIDTDFLYETACLTELCISSAMRLIEQTVPYNETGTNAYVIEAKEFIKQSLRDPPLSSEMIAKRLNISREYLSRLFKLDTGISVSRYIIDARVDRARLLLANTTLSIAEIAVQCGCTDSNYFSRMFKKYAGMTPREYREKHA